MHRSRKRSVVDDKNTNEAGRDDDNDDIDNDTDGEEEDEDNDV